MIEPLFFRAFTNAPKALEIVVLDGAEGKHAATVRRMRVDEKIQLTDGKGLRVKGSVIRVGKNDLTMRVDSVESEPESKLQITLIQALAKGDRDELAVQSSTELGVSQVVPWEASRSISRWGNEKKAKGVQRWQLIANEAAKQSLQVRFPVVLDSVTTDELVRGFSSFDQILVLDPMAKISFGNADLPTSGKVAIVVGPEGGISDAELDLMDKSGATRIKLGSSILRTSTAGVVAIAALLHASGNWH